VPEPPRRLTATTTAAVDDRARERAGDAVDRLDAGDHQAAQVVDGVGLGPHDHVVGAGHVLGLGHAGDLADRRGHLGGLADFGLDEDVGVNHGRPFVGQCCSYVVRDVGRTVGQLTAGREGSW
jgi:hypothetical protein